MPSDSDVLRNEPQKIELMNRLTNIRTTLFERFLLLGTIMLLPIQWYIPTIWGFSLSFVMFGIIGTYLILWRLQILVKIWQHPIFLAGYAFIGIGLFMEFAHKSFGYGELFRIVLMILGTVLVGSLCRDRAAIRMVLSGFLLASMGVSLTIGMTSYGVLDSVQARTFKDADRIRESILHDNALEANLNALAFIAAQGAIVGFVLTLTAKTALRRTVFMLLSAICLIGTFLPMSRSGVVILFLSCGIVIYAKGLMNARVVLVSLVLLGTIVVLVPDVVWNRLTVSSERDQRKRFEDSRVHLYILVIESLPETFLTGVGISHYYGSWGKTHGFSKGDFITGTHNCFAQAIMYWGLPGILGFCALIWQGYRCLPKFYDRDDALRLGILGISVAMFLKALIMHQLYDKGFSLALGMLAGASVWIWPKDFALKKPRRRRMKSVHTIANGVRKPV